MIRKTVFCGIDMARLIVGGNPFGGYSYITERVTRDEMMDYYTAERVVRDLKYAETLGYTAYISTTCEFTRRFHRQYRNEGGKLDWIAQTHVPLDMRACVNIAAEGGAAAIFLQGSHADLLIERGDMDKLNKDLGEMRRVGVPVGMATHVPGNVELAEKGADVDFFMACLHNMRANNVGRVSSSVSGLKDEPHHFLYEDREAMLREIRRTSKPCIAYKILGGGNFAFTGEGLRRSMAEAYAGIKEGDVAAVGIFQRDKDQLRENAEIVAGILE